MKVFLSWSGERSRRVAEELGPWLNKVVQSVEYWISTEMESGVKWIEEVNKNLDDHSMGVVCVTPENVAAPWLNYEAGALAKHLGTEGRLIPYLLDFKTPGDLKPPLVQFNARLADRQGTLDVVKTFNKHAEFSLSSSVLDESFELWWPRLDKALTEIKASSPDGSANRSVEDKMDELLLLTRHFVQDTSYSPVLNTSQRRGFKDEETFKNWYKTQLTDCLYSKLGAADFSDMIIEWHIPGHPTVTLPLEVSTDTLWEVAQLVDRITDIFPHFVDENGEDLL